MAYVCHKTYEGPSMENVLVSIKEGTKLKREGQILYLDDLPVCVYRSLVGKRHFANDSDGQGLRRGALSHAIAYAPRIRFSEGQFKGRQQRFSDQEIGVLVTKWEKYLKPDIDFLLFNDDFFEESVEVLQEIAKSVNIELPEGGSENVCDRQQ